MEITVKDILELEEFKDVELLAGKNGIANIIKSASLMEVPDIFPYIESHNLLLTTLFPICENERAKEELIPKLVEQELAGICIKPARYVDQIPAKMIEQADKLDFPLMKLPENANLSILVNKVLEVSLDKHVETLKFRNDIHDKLMDLFLQGKSLSDLIDSLANMIRLDVVLLDNNFEILCSSYDYSKDKIELSFSQAEKTIYDNEIKLTTPLEEINKESLIIQPIKAGSNNFGYIVIPNQEQLNKANLKLAAEQASMLIASVFYKNYAVLEKEKTFQDAFIRNILQGKIDSQLEAIEKAKVFGWELEFPQLMMIIKLFGEDENVKREIYEEISNARFIAEIFSKNFSLYNDKFNTIYLNDSLVVFINAIFDSKIESNMQQIAEEVIAEVDHNIKVGVGISTLVEKITQFPEIYNKLNKTVQLADILNEDSFVVNYNELKVFNIIEKVGDNKLLNEFVYDKLGSLINYERENDGELIETLKNLIENNFNVKKTSREMYVHYNTLRYRVNKLKECNIDIENGYDTAEIVFAYNIYQWLKATDNLLI